MFSLDKVFISFFKRLFLYLLDTFKNVLNVSVADITEFPKRDSVTRCSGFAAIMTSQASRLLPILASRRRCGPKSSKRHGKQRVNSQILLRLVTKAETKRVLFRFHVDT